MVQRIVLVRHGPVIPFHNGGMVDHGGLGRLLEAYDAAGISAVQPPAALVETASRATHIVASDLRRAVTSAEALAPAREIHISDLFREIPLSIPRWPTPLPLGAWAMLGHLTWGYRIVRGTDVTDVDRARAVAAAEWLEVMVTGSSTTLVVTHGLFRRVLGQQLAARGWTCTGRRGGYDHWSSWTFSGSLRSGELVVVRTDRRCPHDDATSSAGDRAD
jgi:broad specificity phosphatase PhoE